MKPYVVGGRIKNFINVLLYYGLNFLVVNIIVLIFYFNLRNENVELTEQTFMAEISDYYAYIMATPLIIILVLIAIINRKELKQQLAINLKQGMTYVYPFIFLVAYFFIVATLGIISQMLNPELAEPENQQALENMLENGNTFVFLFNVVILAPIVEELVFRYSLVNLFDIDKKYFRWVPYVISAVVFALIHETGIITNPSLDNLLLFLQYLAPGLALAFGYMITKRNIVSMILLHFLINVIASIAMFTL